MDFGSSHVYEYEDSEEEYISDEELKVGMFLRYAIWTLWRVNYQSHCFNSDSEDSDEESPTVAAGELIVMEQFV